MKWDDIGKILAAVLVVILLLVLFRNVIGSNADWWRFVNDGDKACSTSTYKGVSPNGRTEYYECD